MSGLVLLIFAGLLFGAVYGPKRIVTKDSGPIAEKNSSVVSCQEKTACPDCNIILVSADSLRADHVGAYGYNRATTPFFDSLSQRGALFMNYFSASYLTPISEMALHSGMYPSSTGLVSFGSILPENITTMAQFLKKEGYKTYAAHMSPEYVWRDQAYVPKYDFIGPNQVSKSFNRGFDEYKNLEPRKLSSQNKNSVYNDLDNIKEEKFFYWVTLGNIHWPYNDKGLNVFGNHNYNGFFAGKNVNWDVLRNIYGGIIYPEKKPLAKEDTDFLLDNYDNSIVQFDEFLKDLFAQLDKNGLTKKTIIIIESEHGEEFGEHGYIAHYDIYDAQTHVPLLIISPNIDAGKKIEAISGSVDVLPTLASLVGRVAPPQVQGRNLVGDICQNGTEDKHGSQSATFIERIPLWEQVAADLIKINNDSGLDSKKITGDIAIRTQEWKYILRTSKDYLQKASWWSKLTGSAIEIPDEELYNVVDDPKELNNVASSNPEVVKNLKERLLSWYNTILNKDNLDRRPAGFQEYF